MGILADYEDRDIPELSYDDSDCNTEKGLAIPNSKLYEAVIL